MADWGSALTAQLLADAAVAALVGQDIDWVARPEGEAWQRYITLQVVSDPRPDHFTGAQDLRQSRVQADCWSTVSAGDAAQLAEAVIAAVRLDPGQGNADATGAWSRDGVRFDRPQVEGPVDGVESLDTVMVYRARVDLLLWHCELEI